MLWKQLGGQGFGGKVTGQSRCEAGGRPTT